MHKIWAVIRREFVERVRTRAFLLSTILFPVFMAVGSLRSPRFHETLLIVWSLFLALFVGLFVTWHPIY